MKKRILTFILLILVILFVACNGKKSKIVNTLSDSLSIEEEDKEKWDVIDSIRLDSALNAAVMIADNKIKSMDFEESFEVPFAPDRHSSIKVEIIGGHLFSEKNKHVLIRRHQSSITYISLYEIKGKLNLIKSLEYGSLTYMDDQIIDVNGDSTKDILFHWYPMSGCCARDMYDVYLYLKEENIFSNPYDFINPEFYPKEKIILGMGYGHPGLVGLYKYRWNGLKIDTLELIEPDLSDTVNHTYFMTRIKPNKKITRKIRMESVPLEYHKIEKYDWFTGSCCL